MATNRIRCLPKPSKWSRRLIVVFVRPIDTSHSAAACLGAARAEILHPEALRQKSRTTMSYIQAVNEALARELETRPEVHRLWRGCRRGGRYIRCLARSAEDLRQISVSSIRPSQKAPS